MSKFTFLFGLLFSLFSVSASAHHSYSHGLQRPEVYPGPAHAENHPERRYRRSHECRVSTVYGTDYYGRRWRQVIDSCGRRTQAPRFAY